MLVLGRRIGETICIADGIEVVVVGIEGSQVRLGVRAPREVPVLRGELQRQAPDANRPALLPRPAAATPPESIAQRRAS